MFKYMLVPLTGSKTGVIPLEHRDKVSIGRMSPIDIIREMVTDDFYVSRHHCDVEVYGEKVFVRDFLSTNGTFIEGEKILSGGRRELKVGQILSLGSGSPIKGAAAFILTRV